MSPWPQHSDSHPTSILSTFSKSGCREVDPAWPGRLSGMATKGGRVVPPDVRPSAQGNRRGEGGLSRPEDASIKVPPKEGGLSRPTSGTVLQEPSEEGGLSRPTSGDTLGSYPHQTGQLLHLMGIREEGGLSRPTITNR